MTTNGQRRNPAVRGAEAEPPPPPSQDEVVVNWAQTQCGESLNAKKNPLADGTDSLSYITGFRNYKGHWKKPEKKPSLQRFLARRHLHGNPEQEDEQITSNELQQIIDNTEGSVKKKPRRKPKKKNRRWNPEKELKKQQKLLKKKQRSENARATAEAQIMNEFPNGTGLRQWRQMQMRKQLEQKQADAASVRHDLQKRRKGAMLQRLGSFVEKRKRVKGVYKDEKKLLLQAEVKAPRKRKSRRKKACASVAGPENSEAEPVRVRRDATKEERELLDKMLKSLAQDKRQCKLKKKKTEIQAEEKFLARKLARLKTISRVKRGEKLKVRTAIKQRDSEYRRSALEKKKILRPWLIREVRGMGRLPPELEPLSPRLNEGVPQMAWEKPGVVMYNNSAPSRMFEGGSEI